MFHRLLCRLDTSLKYQLSPSKWAIPDVFFFIFVFSIQLTVYVQFKFLPMTGFELWTYQLSHNHCPANYLLCQSKVLQYLSQFVHVESVKWSEYNLVTKESLTRHLKGFDLKYSQATLASIC